MNMSKGHNPLNSWQIGRHNRQLLDRAQASGQIYIDRLHSWGRKRYIYMKCSLDVFLSASHTTSRSKEAVAGGVADIITG